MPWNLRFIKSKIKDGKLLVDGKTWTGFCKLGRTIAADNFVGQKIQPFWIEEEAKNFNTNFISWTQCLKHLQSETEDSSPTNNNTRRSSSKTSYRSIRCIGDKMKIAIIGTGNVGGALATKWAKGRSKIFLGLGT